ncbi:MAG: ATP synthase subunit I [Pyrinomonadaceae bacterium]
MGQILNNIGEAPLNADPAADRSGGVEARIFRSMCVAVVLAVLASAIVLPWRATTGLLLGGVLSLLNYHWLRTSISSAFNIETAGQRPKLKASGYILRYFVVFTLVAIAYKLNVISLPATIAGMCSFVVALFVEAFRQSYFAIIRREESN